MLPVIGITSFDEHKNFVHGMNKAFESFINMNSWSARFSLPITLNNLPHVSE